MAVQQGPYSASELEQVREILLKRRRELMSARQTHDESIADSQNREPAVEEEEAAAHHLSQFVAARIREGMNREAEAIDHALARMDAGVYGRCEECEEPIALARLKVLPFTRLCAADAAADEQRKVSRSPGRGLTL